MEVNVHVESKWTSQTGTWSEPECVKDPYLRVHSLAPVLHYGGSPDQQTPALANL